MKINRDKPLVSSLAQVHEEEKASKQKKTAAKVSDPVDQLKLSQQALDFLRQQREKAAEQKRSGLELLLRPQQEEEDSQMKAMKEAAEISKKCAKIASHLRKGDQVPLKDLRYLMKHDARLYVLTMAMRQEKEDPKKWKSELKPEDEQNQTAVSGAGASQAESAAVTEVSAPAASGGGETGSTSTEG